MNFLRSNYILILIIAVGAFFRFFNLNWDGNCCMHPDERAIIMTVERLEYPENISEFLSKKSSFNPNFFAYGTFPISNCIYLINHSV